MTSSCSRYLSPETLTPGLTNLLRGRQYVYARAHVFSNERKRDRLGFTIVELLVSIAIVAIMVGVLVVGVNAARESSRRTWCAHNLSQIGLGVMAYDSTHHVLPTGGNEMGFSLFVQILPALEQADAYQKLDQSAWSFVKENTDVALAMRIPAFGCPCSGSEGVALDYLFNRGAQLTAPYDAPNPYMGWKESRRRLGSFGARGSSSVALVSEANKSKSGGIYPVPSDWLGLDSDAFSNACLAVRRVSATDPAQRIWQPFMWQICYEDFYLHVLAPNAPSCLRGESVPKALVSAGSGHTSGVNVLFFDGHVDFVDNQVDLKSWRDMGVPGE